MPRRSTLWTWCVAQRSSRLTAQDKSGWLEYYVRNFSTAVELDQSYCAPLSASLLTARRLAVTRSLPRLRESHHVRLSDGCQEPRWCVPPTLPR